MSARTLPELLRGHLRRIWDALLPESDRPALWAEIVSHCFPPDKFPKVQLVGNHGRFTLEQYQALCDSGRYAPIPDVIAAVRQMAFGLTWNHPYHTYLALRFPEILDHAYHSTSERLEMFRPEHLVEKLQQDMDLWSKARDALLKHNRVEASTLFCVYPIKDNPRDVNVCRKRIENETLQRLAKWKIPSETIGYLMGDQMGRRSRKRVREEKPVDGTAGRDAHAAAAVKEEKGTGDSAGAAKETEKAVGRLLKGSRIPLHTDVTRADTLVGYAKCFEDFGLGVYTVEIDEWICPGDEKPEEFRKKTAECMQKVKALEYEPRRRLWLVNQEQDPVAELQDLEPSECLFRIDVSDLLK